MLVPGSPQNIAQFNQQQDYQIVPDSLGIYPPEYGPRSPGWRIGGIRVDNPTSFWWSIKESRDVIPPYTSGWTRDFRPALTTITFVQGPSSTVFTTASVAVNVTLYEYTGVDPTVGYDNGVSSPVNVQGLVVISGPVTVSGAVTVTGVVSIAGAVTVTGTVSISGPVTVSGSVSISGPVSISGAVTITGAVTISNDASIIPGAFTLGGQGVMVIAVTGTRKQLIAASTVFKVCMIKARAVNVSTIFFGTITVTNDETAGTGGLQLEPGDMISLAESDMNHLYINGEAGDGVSFAYWT